MAEDISHRLLQALTDITGEIQLNSALRTVTQAAIVHRLESIAKPLHALPQKYGVSLKEFAAPLQEA